MSSFALVSTARRVLRFGLFAAGAVGASLGCAQDVILGEQLTLPASSTTQPVVPSTASTSSPTQATMGESSTANDSTSAGFSGDGGWDSLPQDSWRRPRPGGTGIFPPDPNGPHQNDPPPELTQTTTADFPPPPDTAF